jgi:DNA-binding protein H-NS
MLSELLAQKTALEQQILEVQREERAGAIAQVRALMSQYGLTLADLGSRAPATASRGAPRATSYRHPSSGETWAGRGPRPRWLKAALAEGARLEDFKV